MSWFTRKRKAQPTTNVTAASSVSSGSSSGISLEKEFEDNAAVARGISLDKGFEIGLVNVTFAIDDSGSMSSRYQRRSRQEPAEVARITLIAAGGAAALDDDGLMPVVMFNDRARDVAEILPDNLEETVEQVVNSYQGAGTNYAPVIQMVTKKYADSDVRQLVIWVTDGQPYDQSDTETWLKKSADKFFHVIIVISDRREDQEYVAKLERKHGNVKHLSAPDLLGMPRGEVYDAILSDKLQAWLG